MKRFIKKVKWLNVLEALLFLGSLAVIIHDLFMVTVYSWFTSQLVGWTWFGLATFMLAIAIASLTYEDLEEKANIVALKRESLGKISQWNILLNIHSISISNYGVLVKGGGKHKW